MSSEKNGTGQGREDGAAHSSPRREQAEWRRALRDDDGKQEAKEFRRRVWREQRGLCWTMIAIAVLGTLLGWLKVPDGSPSWLNWLWLACLFAEFVCFVLLVRRDTPPPAS
jgi:hypothetical protein